MKREQLIRSKGYWISQLQIKLFETLKSYLKEKGMTQSDFADKMGVNKSYVTQVLNGDFDHKISKYVELMLACNKAPIVDAIDLDDFVGNDTCHYKYILASTEKKMIDISGETIEANRNSENIFIPDYNRVTVWKKSPAYY